MTGATFYCNFCRKSQHEVTKLIVGAMGGICSPCVELCVDILIAEKSLKLVYGQRKMLPGDIGIPTPPEQNP